MNRWWCMDCRSIVKLDKHGRCEGCESEAVIFVTSENEVTLSVSGAQPERLDAQVNA